MSLDKRPSTSQQTIEFIGSRAYHDEIVPGSPASGYDNHYSTSFLTHEQAYTFINSDFDQKACLSLNQIFVPYATYSGDYFIEGHITATSLSGVNNYVSSGLILTSNSSLTQLSKVDSDCMYYGNSRMNSGETYWSGVDHRLYQRSIGLNRNTYFVGNDEGNSGIGVAGPLNMKWAGNQWLAGSDIIYGYPIDFKSKFVAQSGYYEFRLAHIGADYSGYLAGFTSGVARLTPEGSSVVKLYYCRSYDVAGGHYSRQTFVVAARVPYYYPNGSTSGESFYMPIYRGCNV